MGRPAILDRKLMKKLAEKIGKKDITVINRMVSRRARKLSISAEAALVILAREHNIGASTYQRKLDGEKQGQIRDNLTPFFSAQRGNPNHAVGAGNLRSSKSNINKRGRISFFRSLIFGEVVKPKA